MPRIPDPLAMSRPTPRPVRLEASEAVHVLEARLSDKE